MQYFQHIVLFSSVVLYSAYTWVCFNPSLKTLPSTPWIGLLLAVLANILWVVLAKSIPDPSYLMFLGIVWDSIVTACTILIPVIFFEATLAPIGWGGVAITVLGIILMKMGVIK